MQVAPEIILHDVERSAWIEDYIHDRTRRLGRFAEGIESCRVSLTQERDSHQKGSRYRVMVEVRLSPNHDVAATKAKIGGNAQAQLPPLINLAFGAIERRLKSAAQQRHEETKPDAVRRGVVEKLFGEGYGFLRALDDERQVYFHRNSVQHGEFDRLAVGTEVSYNVVDGEEGPQARSVQIAERYRRSS